MNLGCFYVLYVYMEIVHMLTNSKQANLQTEEKLKHLCISVQFILLAINQTTINIYTSMSFKLYLYFIHLLQLFKQQL